MNTFQYGTLLNWKLNIQHIAWQTVKYLFVPTVLLVNFNTIINQCKELLHE